MKGIAEGLGVPLFLSVPTYVVPVAAVVAVSELHIPIAGLLGNGPPPES